MLIPPPANYSHPKQPKSFSFWIWLVLLSALPILLIAPSNKTIPISDTTLQPLVFVPNFGQSPDTVQYQAHVAHGIIFIANAAVHIQQVNQPVFSWQLIADQEAAINGDAPLAGVVNYLRGQDPTHWQQGLPTYASLHQSNVYPDVHLTYTGTQEALFLTFTVKPGANSQQITWLTTKGGVRADKTFSITAWQEVAGQQQPIEVSHTDRDGDSQMILSAYDHRLTLTIQIALSYALADSEASSSMVSNLDENSFKFFLQPSHQLEGTATDHGEAITVDSAGYAYVTGDTYATDFPTVNPWQATINNGQSFLNDAFVTKFTSNGRDIVFSTYLGGSSSDAGYEIAVDPSGNIYILGSTCSNDFPVLLPFQLSLAGACDAFISKLSPDGSQLLFSSYLGGSNGEHANNMVIKQNGEIIVVGTTESFDFPIVNPIQATLNGGHDGFITRIASAGSTLNYSSFFGGSSVEIINDVILSDDDTVYLVGETRSSDFLIINGWQSLLHGPSDAFLTHLSTNTNIIFFSTYLGGGSDDTGLSLDIGNNMLYIGGGTRSPDFPLVNPVQPSRGGFIDSFITAFTEDGSNVGFSTYLGGLHVESMAGLKVDAAGKVHVAGFTSSPDFPLVNPIQATFDTYSHGYVARLSGDGQVLEYSTYVGGSRRDRIFGMDVHGNGSVYVTGDTESVDYPTVNAVQPYFRGPSWDAFVTRIAADGSRYVFSTYLGGGEPEYPPTDVSLTQIVGQTVIWPWFVTLIGFFVGFSWGTKRLMPYFSRQR